MSAAVIGSTRSDLAARPRPPRCRLLAGRRCCRGSARARHSSGLDRAVRASEWQRDRLFFLLNSKASAVSRSRTEGLWNVLQDYPDSACPARRLSAANAPPRRSRLSPAEGRRSARIAHPVSRRGRVPLTGEVAPCGGGGVNTGVMLMYCETVLLGSSGAAGGFL